MLFTLTSDIVFQGWIDAGTRVGGVEGWGGIISQLVKGFHFI